MADLTRRLREWVRSARVRAAAGLGPTAAMIRQDLGGSFRHLARFRHAGKAAAVVALGLYLLSGAYLVGSGEAAVVTRFGKVVQGRVTPGLRWHLPWPFEAAYSVNVSQVRREGIGVTFPGHPAELHPPEEIQLLTGDENLLTAKAIVQYRVREPADYLFRVNYNEDPLLRAVVKGALTELAARMEVDSLLTGGRTELQQRARERSQQRLDALRSGLEVVSIDLQEVAPPPDVAPAFRDVSSAAEEKNKLMNDAQGYANSIIPQARGDAEKRLRDAEAYRNDVVNRATGESQRFADILAQYQRDTEIYGSRVTRYRLYVETMEEILPRARKYIVEAGEGGRVDLRVVEPLPAPPQSQGTAP